MYQLDQLDFEKRERARAMFIMIGELNVRRGEKGFVRAFLLSSIAFNHKFTSTWIFSPSAVFGEPIRAASIYASVPVVVTRGEYEIFIIVVKTVEELYRMSIH
ncbi:hypothetical protein D9619_010873 [Psilocybe cf. subviscida]|uniref:Uncharacterized protein n=1 Tax=Psilocybe cf. subviscida TaxID=2480587 RepID=A0A8H5BAC2_9AGAR|nr:hypothetical protein D9619_010873 [Psilocybe cf. subviscida]